MRRRDRAHPEPDRRSGNFYDVFTADLSLFSSKRSILLVLLTCMLAAAQPVGMKIAAS
jgi:hypothetical protein